MMILLSSVTSQLIKSTIYDDLTLGQDSWSFGTTPDSSRPHTWLQSHCGCSSNNEAGPKFKETHLALIFVHINGCFCWVWQKLFLIPCTTIQYISETQKTWHLLFAGEWSSTVFRFRVFIFVPGPVHDQLHLRDHLNHDQLRLDNDQNHHDQKLTMIRAIDRLLPWRLLCRPFQCRQEPTP